MGQPSSKEVRGSRSEGRTPARVPDGDEKASDNTPSNEAAKEKGKQTQLEDDAVPGSSSEERNQRHNQFMDDVDRLIDKEIQPSVEDIIKKPEYNDKDISSADINGNRICYS
ncbi:unnamed protein product [Amoebophrya sp. A25]|nr:unnamed protein product [Amoebophrya sp. A25]|eukprot:GSA25T00026980001.1